MRFGVSYVILLGLLLAKLQINAQKPYTDSLKQILMHTDDPQRRVDLLCDIAYDLTDFDDEAAENYANQARKLAEESNYQAGLKYALTVVGLGNFSSGNYQEALQNLHSSRRIKAEQKPELTGYNLMLIGSTYRDLAYYDSAEHYYKLAIQTIGEKGDPYYLGFFYRGLANLKLILWQSQEALTYLKKAESYAKKRPRDFYVLMNIWDLYGRVYHQLLKYDESNAYFKKMCDQEKLTKDYLQEIKCLLHESDVAIDNGDFGNALQYSFKALQISDIYRYPQERVDVYSKIGYIYTELSQYSLASQYYFEGLKIGEKYGLRFETADLYAKLAWIYKEESSYTVAHDYLNKSESLRITIGDRHGVSECQNIRGLVYYLQKEYDRSLAEFNKALTIRKTVGNELNITATIYNMSLVYEAQNKNAIALDYQMQSMAVEERLNNIVGMGISYNSISELMIKLNRFSEADAYLKKAMRLSVTTGSKLLRRNIYSNYARFYEVQGNYKMANQYHKKFETLNDSIYSESGSVKLAEMEALYQVEKKELEIRELDEQKKMQGKELESQRQLARQQRFIIAISLTSIVMLLVAGAVVFRYSREKSRDNKSLQKLNRAISEQKEEIQAQSEELIEASETITNINKELEVKIEARTTELKQAYKELDTFFYRASHDFRRPITTFLGLAGVAKITVKDQVSLELFEKVSETAGSLDKMLQKLQSISDVGSQQMVYKEVFLKELTEEILDSFSRQLQQKKIAVHQEMNESTSLVSYPAMVKIIIENLIENAIHFAGVENPFINVRASVNSETATIEVEDNGQGIMDEYKSRIFEMYFRANENSKGNGLGLYIAKKAAEKLNGHINFSSNYAKGTLFSVILPNRQK